jgi:hypothetical protein
VNQAPTTLTTSTSWDELSRPQRDALITAFAAGKLPDNITALLTSDDQILQVLGHVKSLLSRKPKNRALRALEARLAPRAKDVQRRRTPAPDAFHQLYLEIINHRASSEREDYEPTPFDVRLWERAEAIRRDAQEAKKPGAKK